MDKCLHIYFACKDKIYGPKAQNPRARKQADFHLSTLLGHSFPTADKITNANLKQRASIAKAMKDKGTELVDENGYG